MEARQWGGRVSEDRDRDGRVCITVHACESTYRMRCCDFWRGYCYDTVNGVLGKGGRRRRRRGEEEKEEGKGREEGMGADVGADGAGLGPIKRERSDMHGRRFEGGISTQHYVAPTTAAKQSYVTGIYMTMCTRASDPAYCLGFTNPEKARAPSLSSSI